jgi:hypothetical protein
MKDRQKEIEDLFFQIDTILRRLSQLKSLTLKEQVAIAVSVARLVDRLKAILDPLKKELRRSASYSGKGSVIFKDDSGKSVEVRKSPLRYTLKKDLHFREVFARLGDRVDNLFRVNMVPFSDFPERLESCSDDDKAYLSEIILTKDDPMRVCFGKKK